MTKEGWLRQRQDFDRTLYTLRQLRKPIFAAVNGIAYGGGSELAQSTDFIIAFDSATFGQPEAMIGLAAGGGSPALLPECSHREGASDADDGGPDHRARGVSPGNGQRE
jgi:enoyl-CoA hydratase/carnithine racemase